MQLSNNSGKIDNSTFTAKEKKKKLAFAKSIIRL